MRVLIIGYGSMGRRRIRLLKEIVPDIDLICVDLNRERLCQVKKAGLRGYSCLEEALEKKPDIAFVCTSPGNHAEILMDLAEAGIHIFTELNLTDRNYKKIIAKAKEKNVIVFMSSTMLYNKLIQKIDGFVKAADKPVIYIYHVGQYLPDWHPWEHYRDFFVGKKETNGVREIFAIQLPWIINTFGCIDSLHAERQKCTGLEIDFNDSIIVNFRHTNGNIGVFVADTVSRRANTSLEVIGEDLHLFWHGHYDDLSVFDKDEKKMKFVQVYDTVKHISGYSDNIIEEPYMDEIIDFLNVIKYGWTPRYSLEKDAYTLALIDEIEGINK